MTTTTQYPGDDENQDNGSDNPYGTPTDGSTSNYNPFAHKADEGSDEKDVTPIVAPYTEQDGTYSNSESSYSNPASSNSAGTSYPDGGSHTGSASPSSGQPPYNAGGYSAPTTPPPTYTPPPMASSAPSYNQGQAGYGQAQGYAQGNQKSKVLAGILGILLGAFGVHNFYLGFMGKAIAQVLITVLSLGFLSWASAIWGLIEGIMILVSKPGDKMHQDAKGVELQD